MSDESPTPSLAEVIDSRIERLTKQIRVSMPAIVTSYNAARQTVSVRPAIHDAYENEDGDRVAFEIAVITDVPVAFAGSVTHPIAKGDSVLLVACSSSISRWLMRGGVVDPGTDHRHQLTGAVAICGLRAFPHTLDNVPTNAVVMWADSNLYLGGPVATQAVVKGNLQHTALNTLVSAIASAVGSCVGGAGGATAIGTALTAYNTASVGFLSTKVKVE